MSKVSSQIPSHRQVRPKLRGDGNRRHGMLRWILTFIPHVCANRYSTVNSLAVHFHVSTKTIRRLIYALRDEGFPILTERDADDSIDVGGGTLTRVRIDREAARRFLLG